MFETCLKKLFPKEKNKNLETEKDLNEKVIKIDLKIDKSNEKQENDEKLIESKSLPEIIVEKDNVTIKEFLDRKTNRKDIGEVDIIETMELVLSKKSNETLTYINNLHMKKISQNNYITSLMKENENIQIKLFYLEKEDFKMWKYFSKIVKF